MKYKLMCHSLRFFLTFIITTLSWGEGTSLFFPEQTYNFGTIDQETLVTHQFKFQNKGNKPVIIERLNSSCGCTGALLSTTSTIGPHQTGEIKVSYNSGKKTAHDSELVEVFTKPGGQINLIFNVFVRPEIIIVPAIVDFQNVFCDQTVTKMVTVYDTDKGRQVPITLYPGRPFGVFSDSVLIHTKDPKKPLLKIPIQGNIQGDFGIEPTSFFLGLIQINQPITKSIIISNLRKKSFKIIKVDVPASVTFRLDKPLYNYLLNKKCNLTITYTPKKTGKFDSNILVHTDSKIQPVIKVSIYGLVR